MDERVARALQQWPNVPDVYGWLSLDMRGRWKLRGEDISNPKLISFINRNYLRQNDGAYAFQNGPQKVYVQFDYLPYVAHIAAGEIMLHTQEPMKPIRAAHIDQEGRIVLLSDEFPALLIDRDAAEIVESIRDENEHQVCEQHLLDALESTIPENWTLRLSHGSVPLSSKSDKCIMEQFSLIQRPLKT